MERKVFCESPLLEGGYAKRRDPVMTVNSRYVKGGVTFAVARVSKRLKIFLNLSSAKRAGVRFKTALLKRSVLVN